MFSININETIPNLRFNLIFRPFIMIKHAIILFDPNGLHHQSYEFFQLKLDLFTMMELLPCKWNLCTFLWRLHIKCVNNCESPFPCTSWNFGLSQNRCYYNSSIECLQNGKSFFPLWLIFVSPKGILTIALCHIDHNLKNSF